MIPNFYDAAEYSPHEQPEQQDGDLQGPINEGEVEVRPINVPNEEAEREERPAEVIAVEVIEVEPPRAEVEVEVEVKADETEVEVRPEAEDPKKEDENLYLAGSEEREWVRDEPPRVSLSEVLEPEGTCKQ